MDDRGWVVDASVLVKWFLPPDAEPDIGIARSAVGRLSLRTTSLALFEVGNVLLKRLALSPEQILAGLDMVEEVCGPPVELSYVDVMPTAKLASDHDLTFYDSSYVAIGQRLGRGVISADSDLLDPGLAVDVATALS